MENERVLVVSPEDAGKRLDRYLAEQLPELSRSGLQRLCDGGLVSCGGKPAAKSLRLRAGDRLTVGLPEPREELPQPEDIPLDIRYEDDVLLVVNKPKGMVVHPAAGNLHGTLVNALLWHCGGRLSDLNGPERPGILHRIDKNTSGLLAVAKTNEAHAVLAEQIQAHRFTREYRAVVHGVVREDRGTLCFPIGRHPVDRKKRCVGGENPKEAVTHFEVLERYPRFTYLSFTLETGRTHQIRVHAAHIGHPVAGDDVYGPRKCLTGLGGQCLHAKRLGFVHPVTGEYMEFDSELPEYFQKFLRTAANLR